MHQMYMFLASNSNNGYYIWGGIVLKIFIPLVLVALGAMFTERGGVVNIGLEGMMVFGALFGIGFLTIAGKAFKSTPMVGYFIALAISIIAGVLFSMLHAYASVNLGSNQIISATAINIFAPGFALFLISSFTVNHTKVLFIQKDNYVISKLPGLGDIPVFGNLFFSNFSISFFLGILFILLSFTILYKTKFGLRLRACGENPAAADVAGIDVYKYRWLGVMISGALAGAGGFLYSITLLIEYKASVAGYGFLALAIMIFGGWKPLLIVLSALFFSVITSLSYSIDYFPFLVKLHIPTQFYNMVPYLLTLIVLILFSAKNRAPKADGLPYVKNKSK